LKNESWRFAVAGQAVAAATLQISVAALSERRHIVDLV
jgi:hypothetical protein